MATDTNKATKQRKQKQLSNSICKLVNDDEVISEHEEHDGSDKMRNISKVDLDIDFDELDAIYEKLDKQADEL